MPLGDSNFIIMDDEFDAFRSYIYSKTGITLADSKKQMLITRYSKRLRQLGFASFSDYFSYVTSNPQELEFFVNTVTTNVTNFFREKHHFDFLRSTIFPFLEKTKKDKIINIWSAGCSNGMEPYTIAITFYEHFGFDSPWKLSMLATDINTDKLRHGEQGVYTLDSIESLPLELKKKYFLKGKNSNSDKVKVKTAIKTNIFWKSFNMIHGSFDSFLKNQKYDIIFCRNVIIYFDKPDKSNLLKNFHRFLAPHGFLFLGHSENILDLNTHYKLVSKSVYKKV